MYVSKKYALQSVLENLSNSDDSLHFSINHLFRWSEKNSIGLVTDNREELSAALKSAAKEALSFYKKSASYENEDLVKDSILRKNLIRNFLEIAAVPLGLGSEVINVRSTSKRFATFKGEYDESKGFIDESDGLFKFFNVVSTHQNKWLVKNAIFRLRAQYLKSINSNSFFRDMEVSKALLTLDTDTGKYLSIFVGDAASMTCFNYAFAYSYLAYLYIIGVDVLDAVYMVNGIIKRVGTESDLNTLIKTFITDIVEPGGVDKFMVVYKEVLKFDVKRFTSVDRDSIELIDLFKGVFVNPRDSIRFLSNIVRNNQVVYSRGSTDSYPRGMNPIKALMQMSLE